MHTNTVLSTITCPVLLTDLLSVLFPERQPAAVYSAVRTDDVSYGQVVIRGDRTRGKADPLVPVFMLR